MCITYFSLVQINFGEKEKERARAQAYAGEVAARLKKSTAFKKADREIDEAGSERGYTGRAPCAGLILFQAIYVRSSRGRKRIVYHAES